jgi:F-box/leucine-rich repeat protein 2/20
MRLVECLDISDQGFSEAVRKLSRLEELDISLCNLSKYSIEAIGISCPLLKSFKCERDYWCPYIFGADDDALIISETMPRLSRLEIKGNKLTNDGLLAILDGCSLLEYLDIQNCYNLNLSESLKKRCLEKIKDLLFPIHHDIEEYYYDDHVSYHDSVLDDDCYDPYD